MKILFLDMDGVLNSEQSFHLNHEARMAHREARGEGVEFAKQFCWPLGHIYEPLVERLNKIVEHTGCLIVLSSTWRKQCTVEELRGWLGQKGFLYPTKLIDRTGVDDRGIRGKEIQEWLDQHPEVTTYAILDDDSYDIVGEKAATWTHPRNFVRTDFMWGLQDSHITKVMEILNKV